MPSSRPQKGINDLATLHPEIAEEADGWDPKEITYGSNKKLPWKCKKGHTWETTVETRTRKGTGCPYCSNQKLLTGFNDLQTLHPYLILDFQIQDRLYFWHAYMDSQKNCPLFQLH